MAKKVKESLARRRGPRISSKNQVTLPVDALAKAGLKSGDRLKVVQVEPGKVTLVRDEDPVDDYAGRLTGTYGPEYLDELRSEWL